MLRIFSLFIVFSSFFLFSSCSFFSTDSEMTDEEEYYDDDEESNFEIVSDTEAESGELAEESAEEASSEQLAEDEDVYYIDEEDEDFIEEGAFVEQESAPADTSDDADFVETEDSSFPSFNEEDATSTTSTPAVISVPSVNIPYQKIKQTPYNTNGFLVNAVYIARPGETLSSISSKIFGSENVQHLQVINPHLKAREVKVGDKIYYSSPNRPQDSNRLLFYFEDVGANPSYFNVPAGSNIRKVATELLGHAQSWKEIYATNPDLQTKWGVESEITVRYWSEDSAGTGSPAQPEPEPEPEEPTLDPTSSEQPPATPSEQDPPFPPGEEPSPPEEETGEKTPETPPATTQQKNPFVQKNMILGVILVVIALISIGFLLKKRKNKKNFDYTASNFEIDEE